MAEAVAAVSVVASILQLVDFGSKLVKRMSDFVASTNESPETFRNVCVQLPLAIATLQRLRDRIEKSELSDSELIALGAVVERNIELIEDVNDVLSKIIPPETSSSFEKRILAVRSLRHDKRIQHFTSQLLQNVNYLVFFQTTQTYGIELDLSQRLSSIKFTTPPTATNFEYGLNLGRAPRIADGSFVGRDKELEQLSILLNPELQRQAIVAVVGMGGMGKTQLCIEYSLSHENRYTSMFWVNAQDETLLRADFLSIANIIFPDLADSLATRADENVVIQRVRRWLSLPENRRWLMIFDNFDTPKAPGVDDPTSFDVREYFPYRSQGQILLTTRSRQISFAKGLYLQRLETVELGLEILTKRSGRDLRKDSNAVKLVERLDGLPLALTSAASFLDRTSCTPGEYLDEYDKNWSEEASDNLFEYGERTLFTTWNLSFERLKSQSSGVAEILRILAFFGNESIEYELLAAKDPMLWPAVKGNLRTKLAFDRSMAKLRDFSLVETTQKNYRLHPCLHDWTLSNLNKQIEEQDVWLASSCIVFAAESGTSIWSANYDESRSKFASHASRLTHARLFDILIKSELDQLRADTLWRLAQILSYGERYQEAQKLLKRCFEWYNEQYGADHVQLLLVCAVLGNVCEDLENLVDSEAFTKQAVFGLERTVGRYHQKTLNPVHNLACLYLRLNRLDEAEEMYLWSLHGCEESYGLQDPNTFWAAVTLANLYRAKDDLEKAEQQFRRALVGFDSAVGPDHSFAREAAVSLAELFQQQGRYVEASAMYERVYDSCLRLFGPDHWITLKAHNELKSVEKLTTGSADSLVIDEKSTKNNLITKDHGGESTSISAEQPRGDKVTDNLRAGTNAILQQGSMEPNEGSHGNSSVEKVQIPQPCSWGSSLQDSSEDSRNLRARKGIVLRSKLTLDSPRTSAIDPLAGDMEEVDYRVSLR